MMLQLLVWQMREQQAQCRCLIEGEQGHLRTIRGAVHHTLSALKHSPGLCAEPGRRRGAHSGDAAAADVAAA